MKGYLAYIMILGDEGVPTHPIAPGGPPPGVWPGPGAPEHPIYYPPGVWPGPGYPAHPIAPGGPPPGVWPPPGQPAHPIAIPPTGWPTPPPGLWPPGSGIDLPTHPIVLPPGSAAVPEGPIDWKTAWSPATGWFVVGIPTVPVPTPSAAKPLGR
ncbi:MAG TPA: hypothetical protein VGH29_00965 [Candidatus Binataceae bacterium]